MAARAYRTLTKRRDFLAAARARKWAAPGLIAQARRRNADAGDGSIRVGYTASKKVGNAVMRNRAKRRLRAAAADVVPRLGLPGRDYVFIARRDATIGRAFPDLIGDLETALERLHRERRG